MKIPYLALDRIHEPIKKELDNAYYKVRNNEWYIKGKQLQQFENGFAQYCGTKDCIGVGNGLDALRLILMGLNIGNGDEVIVPTWAFAAPAFQTLRVGAIPKMLFTFWNIFY